MTAEFDVAQKAARNAGEVIARYIRDGVTIREKGKSDLVTEADVASEEMIIATIREAFPDHAILAEETQNVAAVNPPEHLWVIDPIDGTTNFAHGLAHFSISIAYYRAGQAEVGVVYNPVREEWFTAVRGQGAYANERRVKVSPATQLDQILVGLGFYYDRGVTMEATLTAIRDLFRKDIRGVRRMGTASLDLCMVGCGQFGAFFEYTLAPWDFAAGRLFVEEAGGRVTTTSGGVLPLARTPLLATNGLVHDAMIEIIGGFIPRI